MNLLPEISSFQETFSRILRTETSSSIPPSAQMSNALVGQNVGELENVLFSVTIFLLLFIKVNVSVLIKFPHFALMTICRHSLVLLLHPLTLFHCLKRFLKPSLTLVSVGLCQRR